MKDGKISNQAMKIMQCVSTPHWPCRIIKAFLHFTLLSWQYFILLLLLAWCQTALFYLYSILAHNLWVNIKQDFRAHYFFYFFSFLGQFYEKFDLIYLLLLLFFFQGESKGGKGVKSLTGLVVFIWSIDRSNPYWEKLKVDQAWIFF